MSTDRCPSCGTPIASGRFCGTCGMRLPQVSAAPAATPRGHAPMPPGTMLERRYRIVGALAAGSMGAVYRAEDLRLSGRPRALKELLQHWGTPKERAEAEVWFRREGETLMALAHPAIPLVHDTFSEEGRHYLVMDLVEGRSLEQVLAEEGPTGLPEARVLGWADQVLDVLSYLHSRPDPLIFRDLKPANIMLTPTGQIRLIDFGIARVFTQQGQGTAIGTPGYAPPEQYQGLAEPASDLYALGATMHHLLTGRDPRVHRPFDYPPLRSLVPPVAGAVATAIDRSLALDPRARYGTVADMRRALHASSTLDAMPKLSISGSLARNGSGPMPALAARAPQPSSVPALASPAALQLERRALKIRPETVEIAFAGNRTVTRSDKRRLRIKNRTGTQIALRFESDVPWLRPDPSAALLQPGGRLDVGLGVSGASMPVGKYLGTIRAHNDASGKAWSTKVRLRVGGDALARGQTVYRLRSLAGICLVVGFIGTLLAAVGIQVLPGGTPWYLLALGLVGSAVLRAGPRP